MPLILIIILVVLLIAALPSWGYSRNWGYGYYPGGGLAALVILVIILWALGVF